MPLRLNNTCGNHTLTIDFPITHNGSCPRRPQKFVFPLFPWCLTAVAPALFVQRDVPESRILHRKQTLSTPWRLNEKKDNEKNESNQIVYLIDFFSHPLSLSPSFFFFFALLSDPSLLCETTLARRSTALAFSPSDDSVLVADKNGDAYSVQIQQSSGQEVEAKRYAGFSQW